jgi:hypothetical protein
VQASVQAMVRGAAALAGFPAGYETRGGAGTTRSAPDGSRLAPGRPPGCVAQAVDAGAVVWLERDGLRVSDAMVLERLAIAVGITRARADAARGVRPAVSVLLDPGTSDDERGAAMMRLRVDSGGLVRAIATPAVGADRRPSAASAVLSTPHGLVRAEFAGPEQVAAAPATRTGIGVCVPASELPRSWSTALVALRLTTTGRPVVRAEDLGVLLQLAAADDASAPPHPDVAALQELAGEGLDLATLDALHAAGGIRPAASSLGLHHSTVQARVRRARRLLGYDPSSPEGRLRYAAARLLHRVREDPALHGGP